MTTVNCTNTINDNELKIITNKYEYTCKLVGFIDNTSPYNGWVTFDIKVDARVPKARGQGTRLKNIIKGDIRTPPGGLTINSVMLHQLMHSFLLGKYVELLETNKKLTLIILNDVVDDFIRAVAPEGKDEVTGSISMRNKHKTGKMPNVGILMTRHYELNDDDVWVYSGTMLEAGTDKRGKATNSFRVAADDSDKPMSNKELQAVLFASLYKLTVDLETYTGFNPKEL